MLLKMPPTKHKIITKIAMRLICPFAVLSVTLVWYCRIMVDLVMYLLALQSRAEIRNPKRGNKSRFPVPREFLCWVSMFPFNNFEFSNNW